MRITNCRMMYSWLIIAGTAMVFVACNNSGDKTADNTAATDSSMMSKQDSIAKDSARMAAKPKKHGKASVAALAPSKDKMMKDKDGVYNRTEIMPEFPGGQSGLANYVNDHIDFPQQAIDNNATGTVKVSFVIDEHGKVTDPKILGGKPIGDGLEDAVIKMVNQMPAWKPGQIKGKSVKTRLELPVTFEVPA